MGFDWLRGGPGLEARHRRGRGPEHGPARRGFNLLLLCRHRARRRGLEALVVVIVRVIVRIVFVVDLLRFALGQTLHAGDSAHGRHRRCDLVLRAIPP